MTASATKRWMQLTYARIPEQVGTFFEQITSQLTRGVKDAKPQIDLQAWSVDSGIEVKGGDNTHAFRIPVDQLERHDGLAQFPYSRVLYFLYRYDNRLPNRGGTGLSKARGVKQRSAYLFRKMRDLTVVDHRLLMALAGKHRAVRSGLLPMDPERACLSLPAGELMRFFSPGWMDELIKLELNPLEWAMTQRAVQLEARDGFEAYANTFVIRSLLPENLPADRLFKKAKRLQLRLPDLTL